jgi:hypothetical protein
MQVTNVQDRITHAVVGAGQVQTFGVAQTAEFFQVLSNSLYSNKKLAVVRETMCNAWDAHIEAGCTNTPVKVTLTDQKLIIQDFGLGIEKSLIQPIYGVYGGSTKVANKDVTGGFGLGCKAPFAYVEHFEVTSCHNGLKTIYRMSLSSAVAGGLPSITEIVSMPTTETGITVTINLKQPSDKFDFEHIIRRIAALGEIKTELNGKLLPFVPFSKAENGYLMLQAKPWFENQQQKIFVRYGNVVYPVDRHEDFKREYDSVGMLIQKLSCWTTDHSDPYDGRKFYNWCIVFQAPPNSITVTPSRESLSMAEHTTKTIKKILKDFVKKFHLELEEVKPLVNLFAEEAINQTFLRSPPKALFEGIDSRIPNLNTIPAPIPEFLYNPLTIAEFKIRTNYPSSEKFIDMDRQLRLKTLIQFGFSRRGLVHSLLRHIQKKPKKGNLEVFVFGRKHKHVKRGVSWFHKHYLWPIIKDMGGPVRLANLTVLQGGRTMEPLKMRALSFSESMPFLRDIIIIGFNRGDIDRSFEFPIIQHWLGTPERGALFYRVSRTSKSIQKVRDYFQNLGMNVIDLTVRQPWEAEEVILPIPKAAPSGIPRRTGIPPLSAGAVDNRWSLNRTWDPAAARIDNPEFYHVLGPRKDDLNSFGYFGIEASAAIMRLFGDKGGLCRTHDQVKKYAAAGAVTVDEYVRDKLLEELKNNPKLIQAFKLSWYHREKIPLDSSYYELFKAMLSDDELRKKFKIPNDAAQRERDFITIYEGYDTYRARWDKVIKEIVDLVKDIKLDPKIEALMTLLDNSTMMRIFNAHQLRSVFVGTPTPQKLKEQKKVREILLVALKG